ncbi:uncharacterized protein ACIQIH_014562 isoform 1-T3 [Cyanocitta cristata]
MGTRACRRCLRRAAAALCGDRTLHFHRHSPGTRPVGDRGLFTSSASASLVIKKFSLVLRVSFALCWPPIRLTAYPGSLWHYQRICFQISRAKRFFLSVAGNELAAVRGGSRKELWSPQSALQGLFMSVVSVPRRFLRGSRTHLPKGRSQSLAQHGSNLKEADLCMSARSRVCAGCLVSAAPGASRGAASDAGAQVAGPELSVVAVLGHPGPPRRPRGPALAQPRGTGALSRRRGEAAGAGTAGAVTNPGRSGDRSLGGDRDTNPGRSRADGVGLSPMAGEAVGTI